MALLAVGCLSATAQDTETTIKLIETTDVHGSYYSYDFIRMKDTDGGLTKVASYIEEQKNANPGKVILMDNGDILQGQPVAYYYNFIDTASVHVSSAMLNWLEFDCGTMGNHDVEAGPEVYNRWIKDCKFPVLGANIIRKDNGEPYLPPYKIIERDGIRVAVLGMITPAIPSWLPENLWKGLEFEDMETCAKRWVKTIKETENPDLMVGLFHAGPEGNLLDNVVENGSKLAAVNVPGFDIVFMGHDHQRLCENVANVDGDSVLIINPANAARRVAEVTVTIKKSDGKVTDKQISGKLVSMKDYEDNPTFTEAFAPQFKATQDFVTKRIGKINSTITSQDAFFGSSAFVDLIHQLQMDISGAEVSLCAPLSMNAELKEGDIYMSDMFNLYRFENLLYVMELTGQEIKDFLEMSYGLWTNQMTSADDHLLLLNDKDQGFGRLKNASFNFDSAAGIIYTVDVTKPQGEKINIVSMADGSDFNLSKTYRVAVNSYRGNGGGDLLTKGAGIAKEDLSKRIVFSTEKDLRYYLMQRIEQVGTIDPKPLSHWKFIPEEWAEQAAARDREILF